MAHPAYTWWTGERLNKGKPAAQHIKLDVSHEALQQGRLCEDKIWRQIMTIHDAEARGCDLFDLDDLRIEYDAPSFQNLLMCEFVDDGASIFPLAMLQPCMVDSWTAWDDYKPFAVRPFADRQVWSDMTRLRPPTAQAYSWWRHRWYRAASSASSSGTSSAGWTSTPRPRPSAR